MPQIFSRLRIGTRGSKLAQAQTEIVRRMIQTQSGAQSDIVTIKTSGDRILDRPLADAGGKGLFTKELEEALLSSRIDLAVHSMKDVPTYFPAGLGIGAYLPREDPRDAFLSRKVESFADLPKGARIGTSSVRRKAQVMRARADLETVLLRGNVDTRIAKLDSGELDAILLAYAGLKRLKLAARATALMPLRDWLPALGQGAIGIELRVRDVNAARAVVPLNDVATSVALTCERAFQSALDGSCRTPIAGLATYDDGRLEFRGEVLAPDGSDSVSGSIELKLGNNPLRDAQEAGHNLGLELKPRAAPWLAE
jgi:hydroxymethylbilane synthase